MSVGWWWRHDREAVSCQPSLTDRVTPPCIDRLDHAVTHSAVTLAPAAGGYGRLVPVERCVGWVAADWWPVSISAGNENFNVSILWRGAVGTDRPRSDTK